MSFQNIAYSLRKTDCYRDCKRNVMKPFTSVIDIIHIINIFYDYLYTSHFSTVVYQLRGVSEFVEYFYIGSTASHMFLHVVYEYNKKHLKFA